MIRVKYDWLARVYVAYSPWFPMISQGSSEEEARSALDSAVSLFLRSRQRRRNIPFS